jgi:threonine/homoserine/homoserine lactone efflux protein
METGILQTLLFFCVITSVTPGPSNILVLTASASGGVYRALRPYFGVCIGVPLMVFSVSYIAVTLGNEVFAQFEYIKYLGISLMLYLGYKMATSGKTSLDKYEKQVPSFTGVLFFQWLNPKAWAMVLSTLAIVGHDYYYVPTLIYLVIGFPATALWLLSGGVLRKYLLGTNREIWMNRVLGTSLASTGVFLV